MASFSAGWTQIHLIRDIESFSCNSELRKAVKITYFGDYEILEKF